MWRNCLTIKYFYTFLTPTSFPGSLLLLGTGKREAWEGGHLSTTQQRKQERHETLTRCLFIDILLCLKFLALDVHWFDFVFEFPLQPPHLSSREDTREKHAKRDARSRALFVRHKWGAFLQATTANTTARNQINWCPSLCSVRSF